MYTEREPILPGTAATDYERYLKTDILLGLQKKPSEMNHPDEMTFQVVHQSSELMMKAAHFDLERAIAATTENQPADASRLIGRANRWVDYAISLLHVLETLSPYDYHKIRAGL